MPEMSLSVRAGTYCSQPLSGVSVHGICGISNIEEGGIWAEMNISIPILQKGGGDG